MYSEVCHPWSQASEFLLVLQEVSKLTIKIHNIFVNMSFVIIEIYVSPSFMSVYLYRPVTSNLILPRYERAKFRRKMNVTSFSPLRNILGFFEKTANSLFSYYSRTIAIDIEHRDKYVSILKRGEHLSALFCWIFVDSRSKTSRTLSPMKSWEWMWRHFIKKMIFFPKF